MDIVTQFHSVLGTSSLDFIFQAMASIAFTAAVIYTFKTALRMHHERAAERINQELEAEERAMQEKIDAVEWDPETDFSHKRDLIKRGQWLGE